jgi:hypothetical protein
VKDTINPLLIEKNEIKLEGYATSFKPKEDPKKEVKNRIKKSPKNCPK